MHTAQDLSGSNFFPLTEKASYILLPVSQSKRRAEQYSRQIDLCCHGLHSYDLLPCWLRSKVTGVACWWTYMHQLLLPKFVNVTLGGIFVKELCRTSGNHGSICANFCSPSKTTKRVQISIGLPARASKKCSYWKNQLSTWTLTNF